MAAKTDWAAGNTVTHTDLNTLGTEVNNKQDTATLTETIQDVVGALLVAGTNVTLDYNDTAGTVTIAATGAGGGLDAEAVRDTIAAALVEGTGIDVTYNDAADTITIAVAGLTKSSVGLGNVDNTADTAKPVSTAQQTALDLKAPLASPTFTGTLTAPTVKITAGTPGDGKVLTSDADGDATWQTPPAAGSDLMVSGVSALQALTETTAGSPTVFLDAGSRSGWFTWADTVTGILSGSAQTSTSVNSSTGVVTITGHGMNTGWPVRVGAAVNGLSVNTIYWVINASASTIRLASTRANALAGTHVTLAGTTNFSVQVHRDPLQGVYITPPTDITGASGAWVRTALGGDVTPLMFGGIPDGLTDSTNEVQAALTFCRFSNDINGYALSHHLDLSGGAWRITESLDCTYLYVPGLMVRNGTLWGACAGYPVVDLTGSVNTKWSNVTIWGDRTAEPTAAFMLQRASWPPQSGSTSSYFGCENHTFIQVYMDGFYSGATYLNYGAEVDSIGAQSQVSNRDPGGKAIAVLGSSSYFTKWFGTRPPSRYIGSGNLETGATSTLNHNYGSANIRCWGPWSNLTVTSITKASPAVVTISAAVESNDAQRAPADGDPVRFQNVVGMTQLSGNTYYLKSLTSTTFQLYTDSGLTTPLNSTAFGTFTSGTMWHVSQPPLLVCGSNPADLTVEGGYFLSIAAPSVYFDASQEGSGSDGLHQMHIRGTNERELDAFVFYGTPASGAFTISGHDIEFLGGHYPARNTVIYIDQNGSGTVTLNGLRLRINTNNSSAWVNPKTALRVNQAELWLSHSSSWNGNTGYAGSSSFTGVVVTLDNATRQTF